MKKQIKLTVFISILIAIIYNFITSERALNVNPEDMIKKENYSAEVHTILTEDGYFLEVHRIPGSPGSIPVFIQHGILSSSADWLRNGKDRALPYVLANNGYDVWIGNSRGNLYSRKHKTLSVSDAQYWDFSWHEQGIYDIPATITYISNITNNSLFYVGHSMGGSVFSVMAIEKPSIAKNIRAMIGLVPAVYEYHITQPLIRTISAYWKQLQSITTKLGIKECLPQRIFSNLVKNLCEVPWIGKTMCSNVYFYFLGHNPQQINYEKLSSVLNTSPGGTSMKLFCHWLQQMTVNEFRNFDYGPDVNLKMYNSSEPPTYDLTKINVPVAVFSSEDDIIVNSTDVRHFYNQIPKKLGLYSVGHSFSHADFLWGMNATELVYNKIVDILKNFQLSEEKLKNEK